MEMEMDSGDFQLAGGQHVEGSPGSGRLRPDETQDLVDGSRSSGRGQLDSLKRLAPSPSRLGSWQSTLPRLGQRFT